MLASFKVLGKCTVIFLNCSRTQSSVAVGLISVIQNHRHRLTLSTRAITWQRKSETLSCQIV